MSDGLSKLEENLLLLLEKQEMYGAQLINSYAEAGKSLGPGSLYPTMDRLENQGFVTSQWGDESKGARRKYYQITQQGHEALKEEREFRARLGS